MPLRTQFAHLIAHPSTDLYRPPVNEAGSVTREKRLWDSDSLEFQI